MTCILRVWGADLAVDDLATATSLRPYRIDRKGEARLKAGHFFEKSCVHFEVSDLELHEFDGQVREAARFLAQHGSELRAIVEFPGVQGAALDFGVAWRETVTQTDRLPASLLALAGNLGIGIDLSHYPVSGTASADMTGA